MNSYFGQSGRQEWPHRVSQPEQARAENSEYYARHQKSAKDSLARHEDAHFEYSDIITLLPPWDVE